MYRISFITTMLVTLGSGVTSQAAIFSSSSGCYGAAKCCGCASTCQPECCKPTITRPCDTSCHTYQRQCSDIKPPCCNTGCGPQAGCAPAAQGCAPAAQSCAPAPQSCAPAPQACAAPAPQSCAPAPQACAAPAPQAGCGPAPAGCAAPFAQGCCGQSAGCCVDACEIAELIYQAQTACYAKDRRKAVHDLSDCYSCVCSPEVMCTLIYALNDSDERVRAKAADEIGDQLRQNACCCTPEVVAALTCALADCDRKVRRQAEEALEVCGYEIVDGCCNVCTSGCGACGACGGAPMPAPAQPGMMQDGAAPAPAPVPEPEAYFPSRMNNRQSGAPKVGRGLGKLFGLVN